MIFLIYNFRRLATYNFYKVMQPNFYTTVNFSSVCLKYCGSSQVKVTISPLDGWVKVNLYACKS